jgi:hypothetical protein
VRQRAAGGRTSILATNSKGTGVRQMAKKSRKKKARKKSAANHGKRPNS